MHVDAYGPNVVVLDGIPFPANVVEPPSDLFGPDEPLVLVFEFTSENGATIGVGVTDDSDPSHPDAGQALIGAHAVVDGHECQLRLEGGLLRPCQPWLAATPEALVVSLFGPTTMVTTDAGELKAIVRRWGEATIGEPITSAAGLARR